MIGDLAALHMQFSSVADIKSVRLKTDKNHFGT
jgi:hypothetical protein